MKKSLVVLFSITFLLGIALAANAATYTLLPDDDAYVRMTSSECDSNFGDSIGLSTHWRESDLDTDSYRTYMRFDLSSIPDSDQLVEATLALYQIKGAGLALHGDRVHYVVDDNWDEMSITWNTRPDNGVPGDLIGQNNDGYDHRGWSYWDLLANGVWSPSADLADNSLSLLLKETELGTMSHNWNSKEYSGNTSLRPYLEITTTPIPIPGALWLLGSGLMGLLGVRRKFKK